LTFKAVHDIARPEVAKDVHDFIGEDKKVRVWSNYPMEKQVL
jgi:hypothetical protein